MHNFTFKGAELSKGAGPDFWESLPATVTAGVVVEENLVGGGGGRARKNWGGELWGDFLERCKKSAYWGGCILWSFLVLGVGKPARRLNMGGFAKESWGGGLWEGSDGGGHSEFCVGCVCVLRTPPGQRGCVPGVKTTLFHPSLAGVPRQPEMRQVELPPESSLEKNCSCRPRLRVEKRERECLSWERRAETASGKMVVAAAAAAATAKECFAAGALCVCVWGGCNGFHSSSPPPCKEKHAWHCNSQQNCSGGGGCLGEGSPLSRWEPA